MKFGIVLPTWSDCWKVVERAEELGFDAAWFYDTQLLNAEVFSAMSVAAAKTKKIRLGTGVLVPSNRIAAVTACALATLNALAPGRIDFGVGTGFTARRTMGLNAIRLNDFEKYINEVHGLLAREMVTVQIEGQERKIRFLNPEMDVFNTTDPIRTHISAFGPKSRELTAKLGAGWINFTGHTNAAERDFSAMHEAWHGAGHKEKLEATNFAVGCVLADDEAYDSPRAKAQAGHTAAVMLHSIVENEVNGAPRAQLAPYMRELVDQYHDLYKTYEPEDARYLTLHRGHLMFVRDDEAHLVTGDLIRDATFTGTQDDLRGRVEELGKVGYDQIAVQITPGQEQSIDDWARVFGLSD